MDAVIKDVSHKKIGNLYIENLNEKQIKTDVKVHEE